MTFENTATPVDSCWPYYSPLPPVYVNPPVVYQSATTAFDALTLQLLLERLDKLEKAVERLTEVMEAWE